MILLEMKQKLLKMTQNPLGDDTGDDTADSLGVYSDYFIWRSLSILLVMIQEFLEITQDPFENDTGFCQR